MRLLQKSGVVLTADRAQLPLTPTQWNALAATNEVNTVFQTYEWFDCWWSAFGGTVSLCLLTVHRDGKIIGLAALMLRRLVPGLNQLEFVGTGNSDYQDIIAASVDKQDVVDAICGFLATDAVNWQRARLCNLPSHASTLALLASSGQRVGIRLVHEALLPCPAMALSSDPHKARQRVNRYSVRRPRNWFLKRGTVSFRHVADLSEVERFLPQFFDQHVRRWQSQGKGSQFSDGSQREFFTALARAGHQCGWLLFSVVEFNGKPVAFHFGFDFEGAIIWYKPAFEVDLAEHSPGLLLIHQLLEDSLDRGRRELDFTVGGEPFKERFSNSQRRVHFVSAYRSLPFWSAALLVRGCRRVMGRVRRTWTKWGSGRVEKD